MSMDTIPVYVIGDVIKLETIYGTNPGWAGLLSASFQPGLCGLWGPINYQIVDIFYKKQGLYHCII